MDDYSNEESREIILACVYGMPANSGTNGRYGNRLPYFLTPNYTSASWGIPNFTWEYPGKGNGHSVSPTDFGYDVFTNKQADSRFQKSFYLEYHTSLRGGSNTSTPAADVPYYAYDSEDNATYTWTSDMADFLILIYCLIIIVIRGVVVELSQESIRWGQVIWRLLIWKIQRKQLLILKKR